MNPLTSRKKLLVAESELNRAQLAQDWQTMAGEVCSLISEARIIGSFALVTASLVAGLAYFRRKKSASVAEKSSWRQNIVKGVGLVSTVWRTFCSRSRGQK